MPHHTIQLTQLYMRMRKFTLVDRYTGRQPFVLFRRLQFEKQPVPSTAASWGSIVRSLYASANFFLTLVTRATKCSCRRTTRQPDKSTRARHGRCIMAAN